MSLRPIPATNAGPHIERFHQDEHCACGCGPVSLRQVFYGFSALMSTWYSAEDEKMIEFAMSAWVDEEERDA